MLDMPIPFTGSSMAKRKKICIQKYTKANEINSTTEPIIGTDFGCDQSFWVYREGYCFIAPGVPVLDCQLW